LSWARQVGPQTLQQVEAIFALKAHEEQAFRTLKGVQRLATQYGQARLEAACAYANHFALVGLSRLRSILQNQRELCVPSPPNSQATPTHANLRGATYYQQTLLNF
jgi:hypothetical protein